MYVMTSRYEGFGLVLTEAKAYHLPCVSFKCPAGPSEIISDNDNGLLIDCFEIQKMTSAINRLIEDNQLREKLSGNALKNTDNFSLHKIANKWRLLIKGL